MISSVNINGFSPNLVFALILRSGLGLVMSKFHQFLTELSTYQLILAGYSMFIFLIILISNKSSADLTFHDAGILSLPFILSSNNQKETCNVTISGHDKKDKILLNFSFLVVLLLNIYMTIVKSSDLGPLMFKEGWIFFQGSQLNQNCFASRL